MSRFEETIDFLIKQTKDEAKNVPPKRKLDLIFVGGLVEHLENKASVIRESGYSDHSFDEIMINVEKSLKEIEEVYEKKRKELGIWKK